MLLGRPPLSVAALDSPPDSPGISTLAAILVVTIGAAIREGGKFKSFLKKKGVSSLRLPLSYTQTLHYILLAQDPNQSPLVEYGIQCCKYEKEAPQYRPSFANIAGIGRRNRRVRDLKLIMCMCFESQTCTGYSLVYSFTIPFTCYLIQMKKSVSLCLSFLHDILIFTSIGRHWSRQTMTKRSDGSGANRLPSSLQSETSFLLPVIRKRRPPERG